MLLSGKAAARLGPVSIDGTHLLFLLGLAHIPSTSAGPVVIGHLAALDLVTGQITRLPLPYQSGGESPPPLMLAAW